MVADETYLVFGDCCFDIVWNPGVAATSSTAGQREGYCFLFVGVALHIVIINIAPVVVFRIVPIKY